MYPSAPSDMEPLGNREKKLQQLRVQYQLHAVEREDGRTERRHLDHVKRIGWSQERLMGRQNQTRTLSFQAHYPHYHLLRGLSTENSSQRTNPVRLHIALHHNRSQREIHTTTTLFLVMQGGLCAETGVRRSMRISRPPVELDLYPR